MNVFKALQEYYRGESKLLVISTICLLSSTALGLVYPNLLRYLIDEVIIGEQYHLVAKVAFIGLGVVAIKSTFSFLFGYFGMRYGNRVAYNMRGSLYHKLQNLSFTYYDKAKTGDLMSRVTSDLEAVRHFLGYEIPNIFNFFAMIGLGSAMMAILSWKLTLVVMITMPLLVWFAVRFQSKVHPAVRSIREAFGRMSSAARENISGVRTVKSFARESHEVSKFAGRSGEYKDTNIGVANILAFYIPVMEWTANMSLVILAGAGGYMVLNDMLSLGELVAFFSLVYYVIGPLWHTGHHINVYTQAKASGERLLEVLQHYVHVKDIENAIELDDASVQGHIRFDQVSFAYDSKKPVLKQLSLDAPPGAVIGILGGTGAGKSTLIQLLMRAYDVKEGSITLDGQDIRDIQVRHLRAQMAVVFQETFLFSSTIRGNIGYGVEDVDMDTIIASAKLAQAHDFIMEMPEGYDTVVGERGLGLSGGQRQRIAIARALLKQPKILILDDATSAVDMETEQDIQRGLREMKSATTFIIAHRISSLQHADEIIVLDEGEVVQRGTHQELIAEQGPYAETYRVQSGLDDQDQVVLSARRGNVS